MDASTEKAYTLLLTEPEAEQLVQMARYVVRGDAAGGPANTQLLEDLIDALESQLEQ